MCKEAPEGDRGLHMLHLDLAGRLTPSDQDEHFFRRSVGLIKKRIFRVIQESNWSRMASSCNVALGRSQRHIHRELWS
eukprot:882634-Amphidinium_carterae.1